MSRGPLVLMVLFNLPVTKRVMQLLWRDDPQEPQEPSCLMRYKAVDAYSRKLEQERHWNIQNNTFYLALYSRPTIVLAKKGRDLDICHHRVSKCSRVQIMKATNNNCGRVSAQMRHRPK